MPALNKGRSATFDYAVLEEKLAAEMREAAGQIQGHMRDSVIEVGRLLNELKQKVKHGEFNKWMESECSLHVRTAQRYMTVADMVGKNDKLSYLPQDGLLALARSKPADVIAKILREIEEGERPSAAEIKRRITDACPKKARSASNSAPPSDDPVESIKAAVAALEPGQLRQFRCWLDEAYGGGESHANRSIGPQDATVPKQVLQISKLQPNPEAVDAEAVRAEPEKTDDGTRQQFTCHERFQRCRYGGCQQEGRCLSAPRPFQTRAGSPEDVPAPATSVP